MSSQVSRSLAGSDLPFVWQASWALDVALHGVVGGACLVVLGVVFRATCRAPLACHTSGKSNPARLWDLRWHTSCCTLPGVSGISDGLTEEYNKSSVHYKIDPKTGVNVFSCSSSALKCFCTFIMEGIFPSPFVYFNQHLGAAHSKRWSKYASTFFKSKSWKGKKRLENWGQNYFLQPDAGRGFYFQKTLKTWAPQSWHLFKTGLVIPCTL